MQKNNLKNLRWVLGISLIASFGLLRDAVQLVQTLGIDVKQSKSWIAGFIGVGFLLIGFLTTFLFTFKMNRRSAILEKKGGEPPARWVRVSILVIVGVVLFLFPWIIFGPAQLYLQGIYARIWLAWFVSLLLSFALHRCCPKLRWPILIGLSALLLGSAYQVWLFALNVNSYPFTLSWSETSRFYAGSLFLSQKLYGAKFAWPILNPTEAGLLSLPFWLPKTSLIIQRGWVAFLWVSTHVLAALLLLRRIKLHDRVRQVLVLLWAFLFLLQGPVWFHLLVMVIAILWGVDMQRPAKTLIIVLLVSVWAGLSRINWFPFPGVFASVLYFLEVSVDGKKKRKYLLKPVLWMVSGTATAFLSYYLYIRFSGAAPAMFNSSFTSDLLWYRLLPGVNYAIGVLPGIVLVSLPVVGMIVQWARTYRRSVHPIRLLGITGSLVLFLAGGLLVSSKIGGGGNLHNLDAFLVILMVVGTYVLFDRGKPEIDTGQTIFFEPAGWLTTLSVFVPVIFALSAGQPSTLPPQTTVEEALTQIRDIVTDAQSQGPVLFMAERHLVTYGYMGEVAIEPEYEKMILMEMAMAHNDVYTDQFENDICEQRFSLIVAAPQRIVYKNHTHSLSEENNVWVEKVSVPVLKYYQEKLLLKEVGVQLLVPNPQAPVCTP